MNGGEIRERERGDGSDRPERGDDTAGPASARKLRPLHTPSPAAVRTDDRGRPTAVDTGTPGGRRSRSGAGDETAWAGEASSDGLEVVQIRERWRIDDEWWREPVSRLYFEVVLENGKRTVLYRDLVGGGWYRQRG